MERNFEILYRQLRGKLFLSSMMGITDGAFCAQRSRGCALVQLGLYLAEPPDYGQAGPHARSFLPADPAACDAFLAAERRKAGSVSGVLTCLNLASSRLEWALEAAGSFHRAGGDLLELNVHGGLSRYLDLGKMRAMVLPENQDELFRWVGALSELEIPLVVKFNAASHRRQLLRVLDRMSPLNILGVHINVRDERTQKPDFGFVREARARYPRFLLASGYVRSAADAAALFAAGADMVGIAEPTVKDPAYIAGIAPHAVMP